MQKRKYTKYSKEFLEPIVKSSCSYAECLRKLDIKVTGGNYKHIQKNIDLFGIDTSHMTHQAHNAGKEFISFEGLKSKDQIKKRLIQEKGYQCENCGISSWLGKEITLEIEHIDGNNRNNARDNLKLLCPNCHAQTPTWRRKKSSLE